MSGDAADIAAVPAQSGDGDHCAGLIFETRDRHFIPAVADACASSYHDETFAQAGVFIHVRYIENNANFGAVFHVVGHAAVRVCEDCGGNG